LTELAEEKPTGKLNFAVAPFVEDFFNKQKELGVSKAKSAAFLVKAAVTCFGNYATYKKTKDALLPVELLRGLKENMIAEGLDGKQLEDVEKALGIFERELKNLAKKGDVAP
jgi:hypothetical protein